MINIAQIIQRNEITADELALRAGIAVTRMGDLIRGSEPTIGELRKIASALNANISDLIAHSEEKTKARMLFRRTHLAQKRIAQPREVEDLARLVSNSFELLGPAREIPHWLRLFKIKAENYSEAERIAEKFRTVVYEGDLLSPLFDLPITAVNKMGAILFVVREETIEGASAIMGGHAFIFISGRFPPRMLFTLAHEIGHLLSHQSKDGEFAILDSEGETEDVFGKRYRHRENFANAFASSLLLPRAGIGVALKKIKELIKAAPNQIGDVEISYLSRIFGVSFQVAARRCEDLGLLPPGGAFSLYNEICKIYGSPEKRADWIGLPPRPKIEFPAIPWKLLESAIDKIRSGDMSIGRASNVLNISIDRIMDLHAEPSH